MNKTDIIEKVTEETNVPKKTVSDIVTATFETITKALAEDSDRVWINDFGTFTVGKRNARKGRNPQTGEAIEIPASVVVKFKMAKWLKSIVNGKSE